MKKITLALVLLYSITTFSQSSSINYKALIKDASGTVVSNTQVTVQFTILEGTPGTSMYQETHMPTTDANGVIVINIGGGTVDSGDYATIDWGNDDHFLNTQIDTGAGLTDMGTTGFNAVPYALSAKTVQNISGMTNFIPKSLDGLALGDSQLFDDGANIGIGTTTPTSKMDLRAIGIGFSQQLNTAGPSIGFFTNTTAAWLQTHNDFPIRFATNNGSTQMVLSTDGNLGIGTVTPRAPLSFSNAAAKKKITLYDVNDNDHEFLGFGVDSGILRYQVEQGNDHVFYAASSSTTSDEILRIQANGTITAPSLDVSEITDDKALVTKQYVDALEARIADLELATAAVGDIREGGIVFWIDPASNYRHGLVCALSDYPTEEEHGCMGQILPSVPDVPFNGGNAAGPGTEIGDGLTNTNGILTDCPTAPAALAARSFGPEWFLPSLNELNEMYLNKAIINATASANGGADFADTAYWSSTENDEVGAWFHDFNDGDQSVCDKVCSRPVRAVRAF